MHSQLGHHQTETTPTRKLTASGSDPPTACSTLTCNFGDDPGERSDRADGRVDVRHEDERVIGATMAVMRSAAGC
jgi:hypothetical protein